jgi:hypothetical protein
MSDNQSLEKLWQQQPTKEPDFKALESRFKAMRRKQWFYIGLDVASCVVLIIILIFFPQKMNTLQLAFMSLMTVFCVGSAAYITWLRSSTLRNTVSDTRAYLQGLKHQCSINIKIGHYTRIVVWITLAFLLTLFVMTAVVQDWDTKKAIWKTAVLFAFILGILWPARIWANRQITKYSDELEKLTLLEQSINENGSSAYTQTTLK